MRARVDELIDAAGARGVPHQVRPRAVDRVAAHRRPGLHPRSRPAVVLLDEPSSGIAQRETEALGPLLLRVRDTLGASLLVIEHDMPLASFVSDRIVAMDQGRVIAEGPPDDVLHDPDVIASYLGTTEQSIARSGL